MKGGARPLAQLLAADVPVLMEGAVVERVRRGAPTLFDSRLMNAPLIYHAAGRVLLRQIYMEYIDIGRVHDLPLLCLAPEDSSRATDARANSQFQPR